MTIEVAERAQFEALWNSQNPVHLIRFYDMLRRPKDLVGFSMSRPAAKMTLIEKKPVSPKDSVVVVVPTANANGQYARRIKEYFSQFRLLFVESSGQYFNYARSLNFGIKHALEFNPAWVIISNDDMLPYDPVSKLVDDLGRTDADCVMVSSPDGLGRLYHSYKVDILPYHMTFETAMAVGASVSHFEVPPFSMLIPKLLARYGVKCRVRAWFSPRIDSRSDPHVLFGKSLRNFGSKLREAPYTTRAVLASFRNFGDFGVYRPEVLMKNAFDETYINGEEDVDISYRLWRQCVDMRNSSFRIGSIGESTLSPTTSSLVLRWLRSVLNRAHFAAKFGLVG